ncbi:MAG: hypothetical protein GF419_07765 [Ignavibacteriales bacterium]|nr:hypothetical protein [Ignavibacteriales bacterium]
MTRLRIELKPYRRNLPVPLRFARGAIEERAGVLVRIADDAENVSEGDAAPLPEIGTETLPETVAALERAKTSLRISSPFQTLDELRDALAQFEGTPAARAGLAQAALALGNRGDSGCAEAPLGEPRRDRVPVNGLIGLSSAEEASRSARRILERGIRTIKCKLGSSAEEDAARIEAVKFAAPEATLRLDANGMWTRDEAIDRLGRLDLARVEYVEQPTANPEDFPEIKARTGARCASDESTKSFETARRIIEARLTDAVVIKPTLVGGVDRAVALIRLCERAGVDPVVTHAFESSVGFRAAIIAAARVSDPALAAGLDYENVLPPEERPEDLTIERGRIDARNFVL